MNLKLFALSLVFNVSIFFVCGYFIIDKTISESMMNIILAIISLFIIIEHTKLLFTIYGHRKYFAKLKQSHDNIFYISNIMFFMYLFYSAISLAAVIYYPTFPNIFGLFILIFVFHYFILATIILVCVYALIKMGFRYNLKDLNKVKEFLKQLSPQQSVSSDGHQNYGENRLSSIEIDAIDDVFKKTMRKELRTELQSILYRILLPWSRLFSLANAIILSLLLAKITWNF
ncbi:MAG: hypothetical protein VSS52_008580 [Thiotrichaceae bacterium]|nr:hypothetical protein [Thiotrichaceae bacterium]